MLILKNVANTALCFISLNLKLSLSWLRLQTGRNNSLLSCCLSRAVMEFIWQAAVARSSSRRDQLQWLKNKKSTRCSSFNSISFLHISNENRDQSLNEGININVIIVKPQRTDLAHLCDFFLMAIICVQVKSTKLPHASRGLMTAS